MHKTLLKVILTLFILAVINPAAYSSTELRGGELTDYYQACIKKQSQALPLVKNVHLKNVIVQPDYGFAKPLWTGSLDFSGYSCLGTCGASSFLRRPAGIHRQQYLQLLLFPPHFFG